MMTSKIAALSVDVTDRVRGRSSRMHRNFVIGLLAQGCTDIDDTKYNDETTDSQVPPRGGYGLPREIQVMQIPANNGFRIDRSTQIAHGSRPVRTRGVAVVGEQRRQMLRAHRQQDDACAIQHVQIGRNGQIVRD